RASKELDALKLTPMQIGKLHSLLERLRNDESAPGDIEKLQGTPCDLWEIRYPSDKGAIRLLYVVFETSQRVEWRVVLVCLKKSRRLRSSLFETACKRASRWDKK